MPHEKRAGHEAVRIGALSRRRGRYRARDLEYAVVDVETTGLRPEGGARVCEIAVVRMRGDGTVLREFTTLVDPRIKVTGQEFHGIAQGDVVGAPRAAELVAELCALFSGAVVVGHNLDFENAFLTSEFVPAGLPDGLPGLCTLRTLRSQVHLERYSLARASHALGGDWPTGQHTALGDARACAQLLAELLHNAPGPLFYVGPEPVVLEERPQQAQLKPRRSAAGSVRLAGPRPRAVPVRELRAWPRVWRELELDPGLCTGRFDEAERAYAVARARTRARVRTALRIGAAAAGMTAAALLAAALCQPKAARSSS
ncbi:hypothetical protein JCM3263A_03050 [Thermobifida fusca]|uniref:Exonuclease n=2 Tax=Thermobifida fusca TaxID=2021 RepID=Q47ME2_THEFY|nr:MULTISPECIES: 3'-5' exonuclease [Thermobifida]AAZ56380.1 exonuclease [Thermobifida fusca YX]MDD6791728.1 3'-5' exonuclease [Thermobifida fusca]PPS92127.1 exonuclease [Thermobifida fusca]QOS58862.1 3'-5' exonuclease [Thermobifida fusca]